VRNEARKDLIYLDTNDSGMLGLIKINSKVSTRWTTYGYHKKENMKTTTLFRPVSKKELNVIEESGWKKFPLRLAEQPIFYPVLNIEYARQITVEWNVPAYGSGYVTRFAVESNYLQKFSEENVGDRHHNELWVPAEELEEFNHHIIGLIEVVESYGKTTEE